MMPTLLQKSSQSCPTASLVSPGPQRRTIIDGSTLRDNSSIMSWPMGLLELNSSTTNSNSIHRLYGYGSDRMIDSRLPLSLPVHYWLGWSFLVFFLLFLVIISFVFFHCLPHILADWLSWPRLSVCCVSCDSFVSLTFSLVAYLGPGLSVCADFFFHSFSLCSLLQLR